MNLARQNDLKTHAQSALDGKDQEAKDDAKPARGGLIDEKLFNSRAITIFGEINDKLARSVTERLWHWLPKMTSLFRFTSSSPGGHVESGDVVYDIIKFIKPVVRVIGTGWVASAATTIYLAAEKENRFSLPNTRFLVHQPSGGSRGSASDIAIQAQEIVKMRARINKLIADETGQPLERVAQDTDRDYWMSADEAIEYGIVSRIVKSAAEI